MSSTVELSGTAGRIWAARPVIGGDGLVSTLVQPNKLSVQRHSTITKAAFRWDGEEAVLATASGTVMLMRVTKNRYITLDAAGSPATAAAFATRSKRFAFVGFQEHGLRCYDTISASRTADLKGHHRPVKNITMRSSADEMVSTSGDCVILWDLQRLHKKRTLAALPTAALESHYTTDGQSLLTLFQDGSICQWQAKDFSPIARIPPPQCLAASPEKKTPRCFACSPDGYLLASGHAGPLVLLWHLPSTLTDGGALLFLDADSGQVLYHITLPASSSPLAHFSVDTAANSLLVVTAESKARLYDLAAVRKRQAPTQSCTVLDASSLHQAAAAQPDSGGATIQDVAMDEQNGQDQQALRAGAGPQKRIPYANQPQGSWITGSKHDIVAPSTEPPTKKMEGDQYQHALSALSGGSLSEQDKALNKQRLAALLEAYGEYPSKYRVLIWSFLLQLPDNKEAFKLLHDRGPHPAFRNAARSLHQQHSALLKRLSSTLSCLAHWCPLFGEAGFVPNLVFPLVALCGRSGITAFELSATVLLNWCQGWFENFPHPPSKLLFQAQELLKHHDEQLVNKLGRQNFSLVAWQLLSSLFADVLTKEQWLKVWDHIITAGPGLLPFVLVALMQSWRAVLLATSSAQKLQDFVLTTQGVDIDKVLRKAYSLHSGTPAFLRAGPHEFTPLPKEDAYPEFKEYPRVAVEALKGERERILEAEQALLRRRKIVAELEMRSKQVSQEAGTLAAQREQLVLLETQRREAVRDAERQLATELARLDDQAKEQQLAQVHAVEAAYQRSLQTMRVDMERELEEVRKEVEHKQGVLASQLQARREDEALARLQHAADLRLAELQADSLRQAAADKVRAELDSRATILEATTKDRMDHWAVEDGIRKAKLREEAERRNALAATIIEAAAHQQASRTVLAAELAAQEELRKVAGERAVRMAQEAEAAVTAQELDAERLRLEALTKAQEAVLATRAKADHAWYEEQQRLRKEALEAEQAARAQERQRVEQLQADMQSAQQQVVAEADLFDRWRQLELQNAQEEASCRQLLAALRQERQRDTQLQSQLLSAHTQLQTQLHNIAAATRHPAATQPPGPASTLPFTHNAAPTIPPTSQPPAASIRAGHPSTSSPSHHHSAAAATTTRTYPTLTSALPTATSAPITSHTTSLPPATSAPFTSITSHTTSLPPATYNPVTASPSPLPPPSASAPTGSPSPDDWFTFRVANALPNATTVLPKRPTTADWPLGSSSETVAPAPAVQLYPQQFQVQAQPQAAAPAVQLYPQQCQVQAQPQAAAPAHAQQLRRQQQQQQEEDKPPHPQPVRWFHDLKEPHSTGFQVLSLDPLVLSSAAGPGPSRTLQGSQAAAVVKGAGEAWTVPWSAGFDSDASGVGREDSLQHAEDQEPMPDWIQRMMVQRDAILNDLAEQRSLATAEATPPMSSLGSSLASASVASLQDLLSREDFAGGKGGMLPGNTAAALGRHSSFFSDSVVSSLSSLSLAGDGPTSQIWAETLRSLGLAPAAAPAAGTTSGAAAGAPGSGATSDIASAIDSFLRGPATNAASNDLPLPGSWAASGAFLHKLQQPASNSASLSIHEGKLATLGSRPEDSDLGPATPTMAAAAAGRAPPAPPAPGAAAAGSGPMLTMEGQPQGSFTSLVSSNLTETSLFSELTSSTIN